MRAAARRPAVLALADGTVFRGTAFGAEGEAGGEVVFNTAMTGYQEILTDPSYEEQLVAMTYPEIGNVGVNREDVESRRPFVAGLIVREYWDPPSSWRAEQSLGAYMREHCVVGIAEIDTRALVRHVRTHGAQEGVISSTDLDPHRLVARARARPGLVGRPDLHDAGRARQGPARPAGAPWRRKPGPAAGSSGVWQPGTRSCPGPPPRVPTVATIRSSAPRRRHPPPRSCPSWRPGQVRRRSRSRPRGSPGRSRWLAASCPKMLSPGRELRVGALA